MIPATELRRAPEPRSGLGKWSASSARPGDAGRSASTRYDVRRNDDVRAMMRRQTATTGAARNTNEKRLKEIGEIGSYKSTPSKPAGFVGVFLLGWRQFDH
jgi:hypothetical protein